MTNSEVNQILETPDRYEEANRSVLDVLRTVNDRLGGVGGCLSLVEGRLSLLEKVGRPS